MGNRGSLNDEIVNFASENRLRYKLQPSVVIFMGTSVAALAIALYWDGAKHLTGFLLVLAFLASAVFNSAVWVSVRKLPVFVAVILLTMLTLSLAIESFPFSLSSVDVIIATLGSWMIQKLLPHHRMHSGNSHVQLGKDDSQTPIYSHQQFERGLNLELVRSRRHELTFCLVIFKLDRPLTNLAKSDSLKFRKMLCNSLRWIDSIYLGMNSNELMLICPQTDSAGIGVLIDRLQSRIGSVLPGTISAAWAEFPGECLTGGDLIAVTRNKLSQNIADQDSYDAEVLQDAKVSNLTGSTKES